MLLQETILIKSKIRALKFLILFVIAVQIVRHINIEMNNTACIDIN